MSALTKSQVIAFILTVVTCFFFLMSGFPMVVDMLTAIAPSWLVDAIASFSFITHFNAIAKGVLNLADVLFFVVLMACWLLATAIVIDLKKAG
jgi:ABC-2 type transport system permease protein